MKNPSPITLITLAATLAFIAACGTATAACSVQPGAERFSVKQQVQSAMASSAAVFTGRVTAIDYLPAARDEYKDAQVQMVRVATTAWWKGVPAEVVTLHTNNYRLAKDLASREAHEFDYEAGKSYLIYASTEHGQWHASRCTRTASLADAAADIAALDALKSAANQ